MATGDSREDLSSRPIFEDTKMMKPPNKKKFDEEVEVLHSQIKEKEVKYDKIKVSSSELKTAETERKATIERRKLIVPELEKLNNKVIPEKMRRLNELKSSLVYKSEDKVNNAISRLEWNLSAKTFKLTEEKKIVSEIDRLKRSKKTLVQYQTLEQEINGIRDRQRAMREERDMFSRTISHLKSREDSMRQNYQKSKMLKEEIDKLYEQKRHLVASFKRQKEEFKDVKDKQRKDSMKKKEDERRASFNSKRKERAEIEADKLPHEGELHLCHTLITYLSRFNLSLQDSMHEGLSPASSQAEDPEPAEEMDDGQFVLLRKTDESEDFDLSIGLNRSRRKNRRSRKQSMIKKITHSTDVLSQFMALNLNVPNSLLEVSEVLEELKKKKAFYEGEQQMVESTSDAGFSLTESMMCEMSRQASKTESCEGGSSENVHPEESVYSDLLRASKEKDNNDAIADKNLQTANEELLGAVGGVAESEWSDSATPKSDSQNSDSTVEGECGSSRGSQALASDATSRPVGERQTVKETAECKKGSSPKNNLKVAISPWGTSTSPKSPSGPQYLAVPKQDGSIRTRTEPSPNAHQPLQKTMSLRPTSTPEIKSYAHSVVGRTQSFSSAVRYKKPEAGTSKINLSSSQPTPPSSLSLSVPLSASLNLPSSTKRPLSRSKTMTPTEGNPWRDLGAWASSSREDSSKSPAKTMYSKGHQDKKSLTASPSVPRSHPHPIRSPLSPRHSCPLPSHSPSAVQANSIGLDLDFPPLSQTTNPLRRSSNLSSISSNGSQSCLDHSQDLAGKPPTSSSIPASSSKNARHSSAASPQSSHEKMDRLSSVQQISGKEKSATELWVESSIAFVQDDVMVSDSTGPPLRESTRL